MQVLHAPTLGWRNLNHPGAARGRHRLAGPDRELRTRLRAGASVVHARRFGARRPRVRQHLGWRRRGRDDPRRDRPRRAQHRRRVRPCAAFARWAALRLRLDGMLGSVRVEPGHAHAIFRTRCRGGGPDRGRTARVQHRGPDRPGAWRRCESGDRDQATARYLGLGLASVVNALDPARVYIGGEITEAWDLIETTVRAALAERVLTPAAAAMDIRPVAAGEYPRLRGAAALVVSPAFAAPCAVACIQKAGFACRQPHQRSYPSPTAHAWSATRRAQPGRRWFLTPGTTASRHLHYGRIVLRRRMRPYRFRHGGLETGLIALSGSADVDVGGADVHAGPHDALYVPRDSRVRVSAGAQGCDLPKWRRRWSARIRCSSCPSRGAEGCGPALRRRRSRRETRIERADGQERAGGPHHGRRHVQ